MDRVLGHSPIKPSSLRFAGFHPDAVMGIDVRAAGVTVPEHEAVLKSLFFAMRKGKVSQVPVQLVREPQNPMDANAVKIVVNQGSHTGQTVGYLPRELASSLTPLMDNNGMTDKFQGQIYEVKAFPKNEGGFGYSAKLRVEFLSTPDRTPSQAAMKRVKKSFVQAYADGQVSARKQSSARSRVGPIHTEQIETTVMGQDKITQKVDAQRDEVTFYSQGRRVASASLREVDAPRTRWGTVTAALKQRLAPKLNHLIKKLAYPAAKPQPPVVEPAPQPILSFPQLPDINLETKTPDKVHDTAAPW